MAAKQPRDLLALDSRRDCRLGTGKGPPLVTAPEVKTPCKLRANGAGDLMKSIRQHMRNIRCVIGIDEPRIGGRERRDRRGRLPRPRKRGLERDPQISQSGAPVSADAPSRQRNQFWRLSGSVPARQFAVSLRSRGRRTS